MSLSYVLERTLIAAGNTIRSRETITGDATQEFDGTLAAAALNQQITLAWTVASMKGLYILSDKATVIKTNSSGSPADTITLVANVPLIWSPDDPLANPITTNVSTIYATNPDPDNAATLQIYVLKDGTP
jgi:hypothetical protein